MGSQYDVESYELKSLLRQGRRDVFMDFRESLHETFECAPSHAKRTVGKLDESYEGGFPESWDMEYEYDGETVLFSAEKIYDEIAEYAETSSFAVDPSCAVFVDPPRDRPLEVELRGSLEISAGSLNRLVNDI